MLIAVRHSQQVQPLLFLALTEIGDKPEAVLRLSLSLSLSQHKGQLVSTTATFDLLWEFFSSFTQMIFSPKQN